jgi:hypothetical protein
MDLRTTDLQGHQRLAALAHANRVRRVRAELKRAIANGGVSAAATILSHEDELAGMPVGEVLTSQPRWGATRCRRFLAPMSIQEAKPIGSMTERQRRALADRLMA